MISALKQRVTVGPGGTVRVQSDELRPGDVAEVFVLIESSPVASSAEQPDDEPIPPGESAYDVLLKGGFIGKYDDPNIPTDLSTNPKHMGDFGK